MTKIELKTLPDLHGLTAITDQFGLRNFFMKLPRDWYLQKRIETLRLEKDLDSWLSSGGDNSQALFAVRSVDNTNFAGDELGHYQLIRCMAVRSADGNVHLLQKPIERFAK